MTISYIDTSALMLLVTREGDTALIDAAMRAGPVTSRLARVELHAAIFSRWHAGQLAAQSQASVSGNNWISESERDALLDIAEQDVVPVVTFLPLDEEVLKEARDVVAKHPIRTLDALHITTAAIAQRRARRHGVELQFCTADRRQADTAAAVLTGARVMFVPPRR